MVMEDNRMKAELKDRLREALEDNKMKPIELSEKTGIPKSMISYYLSGKSIPKSDRIYKISLALEINEAWLMGYDVPKTRSEGQKKNDDITKIVARLRKDPEFVEYAAMGMKLSPEDFSSIMQILRGLVNK